MTNKEAIDIIKTTIAQVEWDYPMDYAAAFDKAVEALELIEQKARVLSLDEVRELKPYTVVWKETLLDVFPVEFWTVDLFKFPDGVKAVMVKFTQGMDYEEDYNRVYRLWTAKPTVEQRKEEEWGWKSHKEGEEVRA
jgi:hypothetical protein